jgi:hypothetical protein
LESKAKSNIPYFMIESHFFKEFIPKYIGRKIKDESYYRKILLPKLREKEIKRIVEHYGNLKIYMVFNETTDAAGRSILNILVGECSESERKRPSLIKSVELVKTNALNINLKFIEVLNMLYNNDTTKFSNLILMLSDRASYAIKAGICCRK